MPTADQAICIRASDYSETSQVISLLTREEGLVRLMAKGSKRPKSKSGGRVDLLAEGRCVYSLGRRESLGTLIEFAEQISHGDLRIELPRLNAALFMLELCGALLAEGDPHPEAFDLLHNALARVAQPDASPAAVGAYFHFRLLRHAGLLGEMGLCSSCRESLTGPGAYFSSAVGGMLCRECEASEPEKHAVSPAALEGLTALAAAEAGRRPALPDARARAATALLIYHTEYQLGRRLKTARYVTGPL